MFRVSCIQMCSSEDVNHNLKITKRLIIKAVKQKSDFILTPENSSLFSLKKENLLKMTTTMRNDFYLQEIKKLAKKYRKWILLGSIIVKEKNKLKNRSVLISPKAKVVAYYDKINMYDAVLSTKEKYFESKTFSPGKILKTTNLPWGKLGLTICYDLRFPNLFRNLAKKGSIFISVPSAFTETTGKKHWHTLLKARAIENFSYIFAPAQSGTHWNGRKTFGHSLIVSPDGQILKEIKKGEGVITVSVNSNLPKILRNKIPSLRGA